MPMHSMEAGPSHGATEGALGGSGERKEGSSILPAQSPQDEGFWRAFLRNGAAKCANPKPRAVRAGVQGKVSSQSGFIS